MSQPNLLLMAASNHCEICRERSTWDFLNDFYWRVEAANAYARRLENDLHEANTHKQRFQHALAQCETSLLATQEQLNSDRLDHRACLEDLEFERERHRDTIDMLEKVFNEATRSSEIADLLSNQVMVLQAASRFGAISATPRTPASLVEDSLTKESPTPEASSSVLQRSEPVAELPETYARRITSSDVDDGQQRTHYVGQDLPEEAEPRHFKTASHLEQPRATPTLQSGQDLLNKGLHSPPEKVGRGRRRRPHAQQNLKNIS